MKTIKSKQDFELVFSRGKRINNSLLRIRVARRDEGETRRVAIVPPKRHCKSVYRHPFKRV
ncbi:MAG: ribonuclease P protein component, partial [Paratractidigestivibacter faecalis]|uniref:ribonuclease P protein component n=1 Tax=Paratractidigestivibacter faecalis TaxID=2292441 RepID=UPI002A9194F8